MWEDADMELDPEFLKRDALRRAGKPVEIARTRRMLIRETILSDVPALYEICRQLSALGYVEPPQPTLQEEEEYTQAYINHAYPFYDYGLWTVLERESGQVIGRAGLTPSKMLDDAVELGYLIGSRWQQKGYARECAEAILCYARDVLDMEEVHLLADCRNTASLRTAQALGFRRKEELCTEHARLIHFVWRAVPEMKKI